MPSPLTNYFLHVETGNESKIASFTEIPFQEEATREVQNAAFCVSASFTELQKKIEIHKTIQRVPNADLYNCCFVSILIRSRISHGCFLIYHYL